MPASMPDFTADELARLEYFGDNCELGFVMERLGASSGALLRWAAISPESLLATLREDFHQLYEFDNLAPLRRDMVLDRRYGTGWHSEMFCSVRDGAWQFDQDEAARRRIHAHEADKRAYLLSKLRAKFQQPNPVFVIKCNDGIDPAVLEAIHYQLYRRAISPDFQLLEVCADPARAGTVERRGRTLLRCYVREFATYQRANAADDESWHSLLRAALSASNGAATGAEERPADPIRLAFPRRNPARLHRAIEADGRAGAVVLRHGTEWCRPVDGSYRLHASGLGEDATALAWSGVLAPADWELRLDAAWAIADSRPLRATVTAMDGDGGMRAATCVFDDVSARRMALPLPGAAPLHVALTVEPLEKLATGDRAVIDIRSAMISPAA